MLWLTPRFLTYTSTPHRNRTDIKWVLENICLVINSIEAEAWGLNCLLAVDLFRSTSLEVALVSHIASFRYSHLLIDMCPLLKKLFIFSCFFPGSSTLDVVIQNSLPPKLYRPFSSWSFLSCLVLSRPFLLETRVSLGEFHISCHIS